MSGGECLPPRPRICICTDCGIATEPPSSSDWWGKLAAGVRWEAEAESRIMTLDLDLDLVNPEQRRGHVGWRVPAATTTHLHLH